MKKILILSLLFTSTLAVFASPLKVDYNDGIYHIVLSGDKIKKEYLLPNFVAACCREVGIEGIKYYSSGYNCYVTWQDDYFSFVDFDVIDIYRFVLLL